MFTMNFKRYFLLVVCTCQFLFLIYAEMHEAENEQTRKFTSWT